MLPRWTCHHLNPRTAILNPDFSKQNVTEVRTSPLEQEPKTAWKFGFYHWKVHANWGVYLPNAIWFRSRIQQKYNATSRMHISPKQQISPMQQFIKLHSIFFANTKSCNTQTQSKSLKIWTRTAPLKRTGNKTQITVHVRFRMLVHVIHSSLGGPIKTKRGSSICEN